MGPREQRKRTERWKSARKTVQSVRSRLGCLKMECFEIKDPKGEYWVALREWELALVCAEEGLDACGEAEVLRDRAEVWHWMAQYHVNPGFKRGQEDYERACSYYDRSLIELERVCGDQDEQNRAKSDRLVYLLEYAQLCQNHYEVEVRRFAREIPCLHVLSGSFRWQSRFVCCVA